MNRFHQKLPALIAALLLCFSCEQASTPSAFQLIPLAVDNTWVYKIDKYGRTRYDTLRVSGDSIIANEQWYRVQSEYSLLMFGYGWLWANRSNGLQLVYPFATQRPHPLFRYPAQSGDLCSIDTIPIPDGYDPFVPHAITLRVTSTNTPITGQAGVFNCYEYTRTINRLSNGTLRSTEKIWIAPGIGIIKILSDDETTSELIEFHLQ